MKTMMEYLTLTDGKTPEQIRRWYSRLPYEDKLQLQVALLYMRDQQAPNPAVGGGSSGLPSLTYYDRQFDPRFERFLCLKSSTLTHRVAGKND